MTGILGKYLAGKQGGPERKDRLLAQLERLQQVKAAQQEREEAKALQQAGTVANYTDSWLRDFGSRLHATDAEVNTHLKMRNEAAVVLGLPPMDTAPDPVGDSMQEDMMKAQQGAFKTADAMGPLWTEDTRDRAIRAVPDFMLAKYGDRWVKVLLDAYNQRVASQGPSPQPTPVQPVDAKEPFAAPPTEPMGPFDPHQVGYEMFAPYFPNPVGKKPASPGMVNALSKLTPEDAGPVAEAFGYPELAPVGGAAARAAAVAPPKPMSDNDRLMRVATIMRDVRDLYASGARDFDTLPLRQEAWNLMRPGQPIPAGWGRTGTMTASQAGNLGLRGKEFDWRREQQTPATLNTKATARTLGNVGVPWGGGEVPPAGVQFFEKKQMGAAGKQPAATGPLAGDEVPYSAGLDALTKAGGDSQVRALRQHGKTTLSAMVGRMIHNFPATADGRVLRRILLDYVDPMSKQKLSKSKVEELTRRWGKTVAKTGAAKNSPQVGTIQKELP